MLCTTKKTIDIAIKEVSQNSFANEKKKWIDFSIVKEIN